MTRLWNILSRRAIGLVTVVSWLHVHTVASQLISSPFDVYSAVSPLISAATTASDPQCFNCLLTDSPCVNFGTCDKANGKCLCPAGFGGNDCSVPLCNGLNLPNNERKPPANNGEACACDNGWTGLNCNICTNDDVCQAMLDPNRESSVNATCYKTGLLVKRNYQGCSIENKQLGLLLGSRVPEASFKCENQTKAFWVDKKESFYCGLSDCYAEATIDPKGFNATNYFCNNVQCNCVKGAFLCGDTLDISEMFKTEVKGPASLKCRAPGYDNGRYNCEFDGKHLFTFCFEFQEPGLRRNLGPLLGQNPVIELKCRSGECLLQSELPGYSVPPKTADKTVLTIVLVSCSLFLLIAGSAIYYAVKKHKAASSYSASMQLGEVDSEADKMMESGHHLPVTLAFRNISYEILKKQNGQVDRKKVLKNVTGLVRPGEVLAIMGASGAGKTTCLDILAGKPKRGIVSGDIFLNGVKPTRNDFKQIAGYVDQEDTLLDTLTVYETLRNSALLRLPAKMSRQAKEQRVRETMTELGIEHIANTRIGSYGRRGISGGEKRRVSIAQEVVRSPSIIFADEPTSGLDSYNAYTVVQSLVTLAKRYQRTIIMTIHQPRSNIFYMFDKLLLLAEGGYMVYSGPICDVPYSLPDPVFPKPASTTVNVPIEPPNAFRKESSGSSGSGLFSRRNKGKDKALPPSDNATQTVTVEVSPLGNRKAILKSWLETLGVGCPPGFNIADYLIDLTKIGDKDASFMDHLKHIASIPSVPASPVFTSNPDLQMQISDMQDLERSRPLVYHLVKSFHASDIYQSQIQAITESIASHQQFDQPKSPKHQKQPSFGTSYTETLKDEIGTDDDADGPRIGSKPSEPTLSIPETFIQPPGRVSLDIDYNEDDVLMKNTSRRASEHSVIVSDPVAVYKKPKWFHSLWSIGSSSSDVSYSNLFRPNSSPSGLTGSIRSNKPTFGTQFRILSGRVFANFYRNPFLLFAHCLLAILLGLVVGLMFWQVRDDVGGFQNRLGCFFFTLSVFGFSCLSSLEMFSRERNIFIRERSNGYYGVSVYYLTKILFDFLPLRVVPPLLMGSIMYYMVGFNPSIDHFLKFLLVLVVYNLAAAAFCLVVAISCSHNMAVGNLVAVMCLLFSQLFGGLLLNKETIPSPLNLFSALSFFNYAFGALVDNEISTLMLDDTKIGIPIKVPGAMIMESFGFSTGTYWFDVLGLGVLLLVFLTTAFIILQVFIKERR